MQSDNVKDECLYTRQNWSERVVGFDLGTKHYGLITTVATRLSFIPLLQLPQTLSGFKLMIYTISRNVRNKCSRVLLQALPTIAIPLAASLKRKQQWDLSALSSQSRIQQQNVNNFDVIDSNSQNYAKQDMAHIKCQIRNAATTLENNLPKD